MVIQVCMCYSCGYCIWWVSEGFCLCKDLVGEYRIMVSDRCRFRFRIGGVWGIFGGGLYSIRDFGNLANRIQGIADLPDFNVWLDKALGGGCVGIVV